MTKKPTTTAKPPAKITPEVAGDPTPVEPVEATTSPDEAAERNYEVAPKAPPKIDGRRVKPGDKIKMNAQRAAHLVLTGVLIDPENPPKQPDAEQGDDAS
ncbi:MAG: hypothetical protein AAF141_10985 [Pseudomonadota bacterium]